MTCRSSGSGLQAQPARRIHPGRFWQGFLFVLIGFFSPVAGALADLPPRPVFAGVDANYSLGMEQEGRSWQWNTGGAELFAGMAQQGVQGLRVRLWTGEDGPNGRAYATEVVKRSLAAGLEPYLVIFLSEDWADLMKQPLPAIWAGLSMEERAAAVLTYSRESVRHFRKSGLRSHLYEIGNEIDYGICGVYPGKSTKKNPASLARACWPAVAKLILASQQGVREADPDAKFLLHISHWWDPEFCEAFFRFMLGQGVQLDFAGLSYFPTSNIGGSLELEQFAAVVTQLHAAIDRPIIIPETAYPSSPDFKGQFSRWKKAVPGYPLTPEGQERWLGDFLDLCAHHPAIHSVYYWSPEWSGEGMWKAFALFDPKDHARPAWSAFATLREKRPAYLAPRYFEIQEGQLIAIPLQEARQQAKAILVEKLRQFEGVNVKYIQAITEEKLVVKPYGIQLRASLSGNLDLLLDPATALPQDRDAWKAEWLKLDPAKERPVVFVRNQEDPLIPVIQAFAAEHGVRLALHPLAKAQAIRFGLDQAGTGEAEEP